MIKLRMNNTNYSYRGNQSSNNFRSGMGDELGNTGVMNQTSGLGTNPASLKGKLANMEEMAKAV